jgi:hypothetical protein
LSLTAFSWALMSSCSVYAGENPLHTTAKYTHWYLLTSLTHYPSKIRTRTVRPISKSHLKKPSSELLHRSFITSSDSSFPQIFVTSSQKILEIGRHRFICKNGSAQANTNFLTSSCHSHVAQLKALEHCVTIQNLAF